MFDARRIANTCSTKRIVKPEEKGSDGVGKSTETVVTNQEEIPPPAKHSLLIRCDSDSGQTRKKAKISMPKFSLERVAKVLVLYTGGTIGMKSENGVYVPKQNFLIEQLCQQPLFHDPVFAAAYLEALVGADPSDNLDGTSNDDSAFMTPPHVSSSGDTEENEVRKLLAMPEDKQGRRIIFTVMEYNPLMDSSNMCQEDYIKIAGDVKKHYEDFSGFVILHGTDTMAYTASALAFMLEELGKPVILTGSQIPILETLSDGRSNFLAALTLAAHYCIPEVSIFFSNKLYRGCCSTKCHTSNFDAFTSPNCPPLAEVEVNITVNWSATFIPSALKKFKVENRVSQHVALLRLFPTLTAETIEAFCRPPIQGIVLQSYGAGNAPDARVDILDIIRKATARGVLIVNITQCFQGGVVASYATGKALLDAGVVPGYDMTPECALLKLSYILGKEEWDLSKKREMLKCPLRGELHCRDPTVHGNQKRDNPLKNMVSAMGLNYNSPLDMESLVDSLYPSLMCNAAKNNNVQVLKSLVNSGGSVAKMDYDNRTPLHVASGHGSVECVEYLLQRGSPVHARDRFGNTALIDAVRGRFIPIIKMLRRGGAHLHMLPTQLSHELCCLAAQNDVSQLEAWIVAGADVNSHDFDYQRPLYIAVEWNRLEAVEFLLRSNADPSLGNGSTGESPVEMARRRPDILRRIREMLEQADAARIAASQAYSQAICGITDSVNSVSSKLPSS